MDETDTSLQEPARCVSANSAAQLHHVAIINIGLSLIEVAAEKKYDCH